MTKPAFIEAAYQAGMLGAKLRLPRDVHYFNHRDSYLKESFERGYDENIRKPAFERGERLKLAHPCGEAVTIVYDDITIGDNVALYCPMRGVLAAGITQPTIIKTYVEMIGENGEKVANIGGDSMVFLNKMAQPYHQRRVMKLA